MQPDDMSSEALQTEPTVERKEVLSTFEEAYRCIKEATGVTNVQVGMSSSSVSLLLHTYAVALWKSIWPISHLSHKRFRSEFRYQTKINK